MSPLGRTVSCKSPPHIRACNDSDPLIRACIDSGGEQVHFVLLCPPSKNRGILLWTCRSVGRSVDQTMSAQYLENLLLDCYDISYVRWWWVEEDPYWFRGQRSRSFIIGNRNSLSTQYLENPLLDKYQT
jgi:hypothetical protein